MTFVMGSLAFVAFLLMFALIMRFAPGVQWRNQEHAEHEFFKMSAVQKLQVDGFAKIGSNEVHGKYSWNQVGCYCEGATIENKFYTYIDTKLNDSAVKTADFNSKYADEGISVDPKRKQRLRFRQRLEGSYVDYDRIVGSFERLIEVAEIERKEKTFANKS